jgi:hypothetical protein
LTKSSAVLALVALLPAPVPAGAAERGGLVGFVSDVDGLPIAGAVVSLFGKGLGPEGVIALTDSAGRFFVAALPAGSYTMRASGRGHKPAAAREVVVLPNQDAIFQVRLTPLTAAERREIAERAREFGWLLRHKRRSVLETSDAAVRLADAGARPEPRHAGVPAVAGSLALVATSATLGVGDDALGLDATPGSASLVRLEGRLAEDGHWAIAGAVTETDRKAWRTAASLTLHTRAGHSLSVGGGYGQRALRPAAPGLSDDEGSLWGVGAVVLEDRLTMGPVALSGAGRFSYVGFLGRTGYFDPRAALEIADGPTRVTASVRRATLVPGGDLLTLSPFASDGSLSHALMDPALRAERRALYELAVERTIGRATVDARVFHETLDDPLVHAYQGAGAARSLRIGNAADRSARGMAFGVSRSLGRVHGSLRYSFGRTDAARSRASLDLAPAAPFASGDFHDVCARIETSIPRSDTRLSALYRISTLETGSERAAIVNSRFDVQLQQGLPLLRSLTRAEWELLVAYRNLFFDEGDAGTLDELLVLNAPHRVLGGIAVRF